jgi:integrase
MRTVFPPRSIDPAQENTANKPVYTGTKDRIVSLRFATNRGKIVGTAWVEMATHKQIVAGHMAQIINQLTAVGIRKMPKPGMHADGGGLYLQVSKSGAKSWIFRYSLRSRAREMGLGSLSKVSLADARDERDRCNRLLRDHIDPIEDRKKVRADNALASTKAITFAEAAATYIASHRHGFKNLRHAAQWPTTIETYVNPTLGKLSVADIDTALVLNVLEPIWTTKAETASRVRGRIESILGWAKVHKYRDGENPARWKDNLDQLLPKQSKIKKVKHHAAMPYDAMPAFMEKLRQQDGNAARALEFAILTVARTGEVLGASPAEIDHGERVWTVPGERMKGGKDHRVPLGKRALELTTTGSDRYLFPGRHPDKPLRNMAMLMLLKELGGDATTHGMRSTFKDWARDRTRFDNYVVEAALAHATGDKIEQAYARSDVLEKRRKLMTAWAEFCSSTPAASTKNIIAMRG